MGVFLRFVNILELFMISMAISIINFNYLLISLKQCNAFISHQGQKQKVDFCFANFGVHEQALNFILTCGN